MKARRSEQVVAVIAPALLAALVGVSGCGMDEFLGMEDYQRDLLLAGLVVSLSNQQSADGGDGSNNGRPLPADGISCWDLNGNGVRDPGEDRNDDGVFDARDCQSDAGLQVQDGIHCWDLNGNGTNDVAEDRNRDGVFDALDCRGATGPEGPAGSTGPSGSDGPEFFDVFIDDYFAGDATASGDLRVVTVRIDEPALGGSGQTTAEENAIAFRAAIPRTYAPGNDVTMRLFLYRTGLFESGCFAFAFDVDRFRPGENAARYGHTLWVATLPPVGSRTGDEGRSGANDAMLVVDLPIAGGSGPGLGYPVDLGGGDFLAFEVATSHRDGRTYQLVGAELFEGEPGSAAVRGAAVFDSVEAVACSIRDCNGNGVEDDEDLATCPAGDPSCQDCDSNGQLDACDLCRKDDILLPFVKPDEANRPFTFLQDGFTQELYATAAGFMGGVAFARDGDVLVDRCPASRDGSPLRRFDAQALSVIHGSPVHPLVATYPSEAGCGLTNHPDGTLYSNTDLGVTNLDPETGALLRDPFGEPGNSLGIAVDPQTGEIVYVGGDGTLYVIDEAMTSVGVWSTVPTDTFVDGIAFDPAGEYFFLASRHDQSMSVLRRDGTLVQRVLIFHDGAAREPDAVAYRSAHPSFLVTTNLDGTMTRFDFPDQDFGRVPTQTLFAAGGFRGDLLQVGSDRCLYLTQDGTRYADGTVSDDNSVVRICGGFEPPVPTAIELHPNGSAGFVGEAHTLTATLGGGAEVSAQNVAVSFEVLADGPNAGISGIAETDATGTATFTYRGEGGVGTDRIQAWFVEPGGRNYSNIVTAMWFPADCALDCNGNGVPDACEIARGELDDCQGDGIADACGVGCE